MGVLLPGVRMQRCAPGGGNLLAEASVELSEEKLSIEMSRAGKDTSHSRVNGFYIVAPPRGRALRALPRTNAVARVCVLGIQQHKHKFTN